MFAGFVLTVAVCLILYLVFADEFSTEALRESVKNFGIWAPIVFIIIYIAGTIFIPSTPFMIAAGLLFGFADGLIYTVIGGLLSSFLVFEVSRRLGKDWVENALERRYFSLLKRYNKRLETGAVWDLVIFRIAPIMPFNVLNILMGVSRISKKDYATGTVLGLLPSNILAVYAGVLISKIF